LLYLPPILATSKDDVQCEEISGSDSESPMEVVFVPSNFKTSEEMITYGDTVYQIVENWEQHKPLNNELVKIIMLTKEKSNLSCELGCHEIDRLLCCDNEKTKELSSKCSNSEERQTVVVHNDDTY